MPGSEATAPTDTRVHCRASSVVSGLPAGWRRGERARFADLVLRHYSNDGGTPPSVALAQGWRLNSGGTAHVSLSDTGRHYVVGVGRGVPLGIDAEAVRPVDDALQTLRRLRLDRLMAAVAALPPVLRNRAFLQIWTAFESFLKLERLAWEDGARRFSALEQHWIVGRDGGARFQRGRAGLAFEHVEVENKLIVGIATPIPATVQLKRTIFPLHQRRSSGISSVRARL